MPTQDDVKHDLRYICIHNHGFVGLVDTMGSDEAVEEAARVSYGGGTRKISDTRNLIRYLVSHHHTSPLEMCEVKFHIKLPIFVMRQLVRHRTANLNEYSARYSEMPDEFYIPQDDYICSQSKTNKQGRGNAIPGLVRMESQSEMKGLADDAYFRYQAMIDQGITRETARMVLPVSVYTECYWKIDLKNFFGFLKLRCDSHAQQEIQDFAWAMRKLAAPKFPILFEAWNDYIWEAQTFSMMEQTLMWQILNGIPWDKAVADTPPRLKMGKRELAEFRIRLNEMWPDVESWMKIHTAMKEELLKTEKEN